MTHGDEERISGAAVPDNVPNVEDDTPLMKDKNPGLASHATKTAKIGRLGSIYFFALVVERCVGILLLRVFTTYLDRPQMGVVILSGQIAQFLMIFVQLGVLGALWRFYFHTEEAERPQLIRSVTIGLFFQFAALCVGLSLLGIWIADRLLPNLPIPESYVFPLWLMIVWGCFFGAMILTAAQLLKFQERAIAAVSLELFRYGSGITLGVVAVVWLGWLGFGRQGTIFIGSVLCGIVALATLWRLGKGSFQFSKYLEVLRTGLTFVPHSLSGVLAPTVTIWLLNSMVSTAAVGVYGISMMFGIAIQMPLSSFRAAMYPTLAESMRNGDVESRRQHARLLTLLNIGLLNILLGVWMFAPLAIQLLTAPAYHEAGVLVGILVIAWLFQALLVSVQPPLLFFGRGLLLSSGTIVALLTTIVLGLMLIPRYEAYGAAWAVAGGFATRFLLVVVLSFVIYPLPWEWGKTGRLLCCCVAMGWVSWSLPEQWPWIANLAVQVVLYCMLPPILWATRVVTTREIRQAWQMGSEKIRSLVGRDQAKT